MQQLLPFYSLSQQMHKLELPVTQGINLITHFLSVESVLHKGHVLNCVYDAIRVISEKYDYHEIKL